MHAPQRLFAVASASLLTITLLAQLPLPFATGFDDAGQQAGWIQYRKGHLSNYDWGYTASGAPSPPNFLWHDYPVGGAATDTVRDWFVSPSIDLSDGGYIAFKAQVYSIVGAATEVDEFKVYLLQGSSNPDAAAVITEIADFTDMVSTNTVFAPMPAMYIPSTSGICHIGFKYQATNNWFTIGVDNITLTAQPLSVAELSEAVDVVLFPNPVVDELHITINDGDGHMPLVLQVHSTTGALVHQERITGRAVVKAPWPAGIYAYRVSTPEGTAVRNGTLAVGR